MEHFKPAFTMKSEFETRGKSLLHASLLIFDEQNFGEKVPF